EPRAMWACSSSSASQLTPQYRLCLNKSTGRSRDSAIAASSAEISTNGVGACRVMGEPLFYHRLASLVVGGRPEPRGSTDAARVAMGRADESSVHAIRENPCGPQLGHAYVESVDVRQSPAEHDHIRIEHVDHA